MVLAGASAGARRRLLDRELAPLAATRERSEGGYRDGARRVAVVRLDLRRGGRTPSATYDAHAARPGPREGLTALGAGRALRRDADGRLSLVDARGGVVAELGTASMSGGRFSGDRVLLRAPARLAVRLSADRSRGLHLTERGVLRVWETRGGRHLLSLAPAHGGRFVDAAFSGDDGRVVTLSEDGWIDHWGLVPQDLRALVLEHLAATNLRVCRGDLRVVVAPSPLDPETLRSPWAPPRACAPGG